MKLPVAEQILRTLVNNTRLEIQKYAESTGINLDLNNLDDRNIVVSIIHACQLNDMTLEDEIIETILDILDITDYDRRL